MNAFLNLLGVIDIKAHRNVFRGAHPIERSTSADRALDGIVAGVFKVLGENLGIGDGKSARNLLFGREFDDEREVGPALLLDVLADFASDAGAILEAAAEFIEPAVGEFREELLDKIAVSAVDLDAVETSLLGANGRVAEHVDVIPDFFGRELMRGLVEDRAGERRGGRSPGGREGFSVLASRLMGCGKI